uniref:hypothetical protein n=1 Tax=Acinetobacter baumannii TaxID=470 RepID=UPI001C07BFAA
IFISKLFYTHHPQDGWVYCRHHVVVVVGVGGVGVGGVGVGVVRTLDGPLQRDTVTRRWVSELDIEWYDAVLKAFPRAKFEPFVEISIFDKVMWFLRLSFFPTFPPFI